MTATSACSCFLVLMLFLLLVPPSLALTDEEVFRDFRFNLINPGARARGIGGAFVSLADDATAAQSNPAGLSFLRRSEFFAELRYVDTGATSSVVNETLPTGLDTFVATGTDIEDGANLSFVSGVWARDRWSISLSRQEVINLNNTTLSTLAFRYPDSPGVFLVEGDGSIEVQAVNWNLSGGFRATDRLSFGVTVAYAALDVNSRVTNTIVDTEGTFANKAVLEPTLDLQTTIDDNDSDWIFNVGVLYRTPGKWSIGAMYRQGPTFAVNETITSVPDGLDVFGVTGRLGTTFTDHFSLPDTAAIGASGNITERLTIAGDIDYIRYSNLLDGYVPGVNVLTASDAEFEIDDSVAYRLGLEYVLPNQGVRFPPVVFRGGGYTEESGTIQPVDTGTNPFATEGAFQDSGRENHLTLGLGFVMKQVKLDMAADLAEIDNEFLMSFIYQFK